MCDDTVFDYAKWHANLKDIHPVLSISVFVLWIALLFYLIYVATERHMVHVMHAIAKALRMSDNVAGSTLLSWGNGVAELFSAFYGARKHAKMIVSASIGNLLAMVVGVQGLVYVIASAHASNKPRLMNQKLHNISIGIQLVTCIVLGVILWYEAIPLWMAVIMLIAYAGYVALMVFLQTEETPTNRSMLTISQASRSTMIAVDGKDDQEDPDKQASWQTVMRILLFGRVSNWSLGRMTFAILVSPIHLVLKLVLPNVKSSVCQSNALVTRLSLIVSPVICMLLIPIQFDELSYNTPTIALLLFAGVAMCTLLSLNCDGLTMRIKAMHVIYVFAACVLVISVLSKELIGVLSALNTLFKVPPLLVGMVPLAWGNIVGDVAAAVTLASTKHYEMALAAVRAVPVQSVFLILALVAVIIGSGRGSMLINDVGVNMYAALGCVFVVVILNGLVIPFYNGYRMSVGYGFVLMSLYSICIFGLALRVVLG